jgi:TRAP-type mannitol/chloroaromatic compound transport system substrate-binding protein
VLTPMRTTLSWALVAVLAAILPLSGTAHAGEQPRLTLEVVTSYPAGVPILGDSIRTMAARVKSASNGELSLEFHQPGQWGAAAEIFGAVGSGKQDAVWAGAGWLASEDSAFGLFYAIPFGPNASEYLAWLYHGGGLDLAREMFHRRGIHNLPCVILPPAGAGWFRKRINTLGDLQGVRIRSFSLGEKVMQKVGADPRPLAPADILESWKTGQIEAVDFLIPTVDQAFGLSATAQYYYFPSWHKQSALFQFFINKSIWDSLGQGDRSVIENACRETMLEGIIASEATQAKAMKEMQAGGVQLRRWPPEVLIGLEKAWNEVVKEESAKNPNFKRVYDSYAAFHDDLTIWRHFSPLH